MICGLKEMYDMAIEAVGKHIRLPSAVFDCLSGKDDQHVDAYLTSDGKVQDWFFDQYQSEALLTAECPLIGHPIIYPFLGIVGEFGELCEKLIHSSESDRLNRPLRDEIIKELGDVIWYVAVMADRLGLRFSELSILDIKSLSVYASNTDTIGVPQEIQPILNEITISLGHLGERVKKLFRDGYGDITDDRKKALVEELSNVLWWLASLCRAMKIDLSLVAHVNIHKLRSRRQRNMIRGEGDNR